LGARRPSAQVFSAKVRIVDINPYVAIPDPVVHQLQRDARKEAGPIPVRGEVQGKRFATTAVRFRGLWRLYFNTQMRRAAGVEVGDRVRIEVRFDASPPVVRAPLALTSALAKNKTAREAYERLTPSHRKEILRYLNSLKRPESLERNIRKVIRELQG